MNSTPAAATPVRRVVLALVVFAVHAIVATAAAQAWSNRDVGDVGAAGSFAWGGAEYVIRGSGADIWETRDAFHYVYYPWTGDGEFTVRVTGMTDTHAWAKAGIMLREDLTPGSRHVMVCRNPGNAAGLYARTTPGGATDFTLGTYEIPQMWLRLVRRGNSFTGFQSADGVSWRQIGAAVTVNLPATVNAGFAVTSHDTGVLCTASFTNYNFAGTPEYPIPPRAPSGLTATATSP
ncbi:MAG: hypothetical protein RIQ93_1984, partial [Verrucomicrobiota bacterium]